MPQSVRAVLTDLDDTLFDHYRATRSALDRVLGSDPAFLGWSLDDLDSRHRELLEAFHVEVLAGRLSPDDARVERFRRLLDIAGGENAGRRASDIAHAYRLAYETCWHPIAGAQELMAQIKADGLCLVVVTNNVVLEQQQKLTRLGLAPFVDHLVTSEEAGCSKPAADIFHQALRRAGADPDEAVMLGDAWATDIEGARAAGLRPVWFNRFKGASPDPTVDELASLEPAVEAIRILTGS